MDQIHHFSYGWVTPTFAYALSFLGSLLGLVCTARAQSAATRKNAVWMLVLAAWAIGGTGIWVMHFMAMIGFSVPASDLRYDVWLTLASFVIAVVMVGFGLLIVGIGRPSLLKVLASGPITGIGVGFMHYTGMAAMRINGEIRYDRNLVLASFAIAVIAATVALGFTVVVRGAAATVVAAAVMGVAVCGMHYTGMAAMRVQVDPTFTQVSGVSVLWFLAPIVLFITVVVFTLANTVMALPSANEQEEADKLRVAMSGPGSLRP